MRMDIHTLGAWLEKVCQEGIALEHKILAWKQAEDKATVPVWQREETKAS